MVVFAVLVVSVFAELGALVEAVAVASAGRAARAIVAEIMVASAINSATHCTPTAWKRSPRTMYPKLKATIGSTTVIAGSEACNLSLIHI